MVSLKVSIIVPVFNVDKYLRQCLDSILTQTYTDWECILVDDGSKDSSGEICDEYINQDNRFRVFHKENGGVSSARNRGIEEARGEWLFFADADDTLDINCLKILLNETSKNCQLVMAGFRKYSDEGQLIADYDSKRHKIITKDEAITELYIPSDLPYQGYLWCKLFSSAIIRKLGLTFDESIYFNEDRLFVMQYLCRMEGKIAYTTSSIYNYVERSMGAMSSLSIYYNRKYATDFDAYVLMKKEVFSYTQNRGLHRMALKGLISSCNHQLMYMHKDYDANIHRKMLIGLLRTGAIWYYFHDVMKSFIKKMIFLLFPQIIKLRK